MVVEIEPIEAARDVRRDVRVEQMRRYKDPPRPIPADEMAERLAVELRGSPLFQDVPARRGRKRGRLRK